MEKKTHALACFYLCTILYSCLENPNNNPKTSEPTPIFVEISTDQSNLTFSNTLKENLETKENLFNYDYFYNGAGVGVADINNDGLQDIFFCGNQVPNKLFLNKGDFKFEDISATAGINEGKTWANGVTFLDYNSDGYIDIYISQGGPHEREKRKNCLYLNLKNQTFKNIAGEVGLDDSGISTQSAFFDMDNDGDLDCIVMNENEFYGVDPYSLPQLVNSTNENRYFNSSHIYKNENGIFKDITQKAGIERPIFGLGLAIADFNEDGWQDIYIASDYYIPDALYINQKNLTYTDQIKEYTNHISFYGMGMDIADINNDGLEDIFVLDMAANDHVRSKTLMASMNTSRFNYLVETANYHYQYMYNSLQLNQGNGRYSNIAQLTHTAQTDWSWSVLMNDYDLDGDKDLFITNGYRRYALDNDLQAKVFEAQKKYKGKVPLSIKKRLYEEMPSEKLNNILYENLGELNFRENSKNWGLNTKTFSNGAAVADFDNDGDLDLVINNLDDNALLYQNTTIEKTKNNFITIVIDHSEKKPIKINVYANQGLQTFVPRSTRGYRSAMPSYAHFGFGTNTKIDSIVAHYSHEKRICIKNPKLNQIISLSEYRFSNPISTKNAAYSFKIVDPNKIGLIYKHRENTFDDFAQEILLPYKQSNFGPCLAKADVNADGLADLFMGNASGTASTLFIQQQDGTFKKSNQKAFEADKNHEDQDAEFLDIDNDGDLDLIVISGGNEFERHSTLYADRLYINDGKGNFNRDNSSSLSTHPKSGGKVAVIDYNKDGHLDVLVGNRIIPKNYPRPESSTLYQNVNGTLIDNTLAVAPELQSFGIINDILVTDFDQDDWQDFIAVGEWGEIGFFRNVNGIFKKVQLLENSNQTKGWWFSITALNINDDAYPDYLIGNVGENLKFDATTEKPFKVFANDFDQNGTPDIVLSKKYKDEYVPVRGRECSSQQMPFIQEKFKTYNEFANAKLIDVYGDALTSAYKAEATTFSSLLLLSNPKGNKYEIKKLPIQAQAFPLLAAQDLTELKEYNNCILIGGNIYETEVETPRLDAISGLILQFDIKGETSIIPQTQTGLYLDGNVKDIIKIKTNNGYLFIIGRNNDTPLVYEYKI